jgi:hypothetical protein
MRDSGQKIEKMGLVCSRIIMARNTKEIGWMGKNMEKELTTTKLEMFL